MRSLLFFVFAFLFSVFHCYAQKLPIAATRISNAPKMDGHLDDACWQQGVPFNQFLESAPDVGIPGTEKTEAIVLYDDQAIYVGVKCFMHADSVWKEMAQRDNLMGSGDAIFVGFDTYHDGQNGFGFGVSPQNVQSDFKLYQNSEIDDPWDAVWDSKTSMDENGWYVEFKIPYSAIRFPKAEEQDWAIDFYRIVRIDRHEYHSCNFDPKANGLVGQWQPLTGVSDIAPPLRLSLAPYGTCYDNLFTDPSDHSSENHFDFKGGMDLKWGISESFTLDATLIPDFGQVQSDNVIYNNSAFETQYDEKRSFFTEGTELFNKAELFYSRRIGFASDYWETNGDPSVSLLNPPSTTRLLNATKISGRTKGGMGIGIFNAITGNTFCDGVNNDGDTIRVLHDPATNYNVFVLDQSLKNNSYVTFTNTNVTRDEGGRDANVSSLMTAISNKEQSYTGTGYLSVSTLMNKSAGSDNIDFTNGYVYKLRLKKISGNFTGEISHRTISPDYDDNDLGYISISNVSTAQASINYDLYNSFGKFNELHWNNFFGYDYRFTNGAFENAAMDGNFFLLTKKYLGLFSYYYAAPIGGNDYYEPRVEGRFYKYPATYELGLGISTDYRKHLALDVEGGPAKWNEAGRIKYRWNISPRIRIGNRLLIVPSSGVHLYKNDVGFVDVYPAEDADSIFFGRRDITEIDNIINCNYIFNSNMSLGVRVRYYSNKGIYNRYYLLQQNGTLAETAYSGSGDYNFNAWNIDLNFAWWFLPGSELDVVWKNSISSFDDITNLDFAHNFDHTFDSPMNNSFSVRVRYYFDYLYLKKWFAK